MTANVGTVKKSDMPSEGAIKVVAQKVRQRREERNQDQDLARYGGPTRATVGLLENQGRWPLRPRTRTSWAKALGWQPDAFDRMVRGEEPLELQEPPPENDDGRLAELVQRLRDLADEAERLLGER